MNELITFALLVPSLLFNLFLFKAAWKLTKTIQTNNNRIYQLKDKISRERNESINLTLPITKKESRRFFIAWNKYRANKTD